MAGVKQDRQRGNGIYATAAFIIIAAACVLGVGIFFKVSVIEVIGNSIYEAERIIEVSGIEYDTSIFFINASESAARIKQALPYADDVRVIPSLPDSVTIEIVESFPLAYIEVNGKLWLVDKNARFLEETTLSGIEGKLEIRGITADSAEEGATIDLGDRGGVRLQYMQDVLTSILESGLREGVTYLDMTTVSDIRFDYYNYTINVGSGEDLDNKFWTLEMFLEEHGNDGSGIIDMSIDGQLRYNPAD